MNAGWVTELEIVADAFGSAVMLYAIHRRIKGPANVYSAIAGFMSPIGSPAEDSIFTTPWLSVQLYRGFMLRCCPDFADNPNIGLEGGGLKYFPDTGLRACDNAVPSSTLATALLLRIEGGKVRFFLHKRASYGHDHRSPERLPRYFYSPLAIRPWFVILGLPITRLVHLLYWFNAKRFEEIRRGEAEKRRHIEEMATIHMNTIESLAIAIDAKDQTTHGHVRRTQIYARKMGKVFSVTELELRALVAGALLHDIGKLAVPEYILNKPGKLTEAEFAQNEDHPV